MDEYQRAEVARQAEADERNRIKYCPNCSGVSPGGGNCPSCLAAVTAAERGADIMSWLTTDTFTAFGADDVAPDEKYPTESWSTDDGDGCDVDGHDGQGEEDPPYRNPPDHHIYPREFADEFKEAGIDIDEHTVTLYEFQHHIVHSEGWNPDWDMFFELARVTGMQPTREDVIAYGEYLIEKYDLTEAVIHPFHDHGGDLGPHLF